MCCASVSNTCVPAGATRGEGRDANGRASGRGGAGGGDRGALSEVLVSSSFREGGGPEAALAADLLGATSVAEVLGPEVDCAGAETEAEVTGCLDG